MPTQFQTGLTPVVQGQQSYPVVFPAAFSAAPEYAKPVYQPGAAGEANEAVVARDTLSPTGFTAWLRGVPGENALGAQINWSAAGNLA